MDTAVIVAIVSAIEGLGIAVIGVIVSGINRKNEQYRMAREEREAIERKEREQAEYEAAKLDLLFATIVALTMAVLSPIMAALGEAGVQDKEG